MKQYAYRIYKNAPSNPIIGGTVTVNSIESALQKIVNSNNVQVVHESIHGLKHHYFVLNGYKVGILIYLRPEDL